MAGENLLVVDDSPTVLKVVESALTRAGYRVDTALDVESAMTIARSRRPAVILIDSLIPAAPKNGSPTPQRELGHEKDHDDKGASLSPIGGFRLCGALAADAALSHTPVVLMTAKGEDLEGRYGQAPNVIDYITKPFSPDAVLAVVTHVIEKTGGGTKDAAPVSGGSGAHSAEKTSAVAQALARSSGPASIDPLARLRDKLLERLERYRAESGSLDIAEISRCALPDDALAALLADAGFQAAEGTASGPHLSGQLDGTSLGDVLTLLGQQGQTGTIRVLAHGARIELFFKKGQIDLAVAVGVAEEFLLGRFAVEAGDITPDALARVLDARARMGGKAPLFGRDLVERGLITPEQLKSAMRRQTAELAYEALRWSRGTFQFKRGDELPDVAQEAALGIAVDTLLLEGFRRVDEWGLIERDIPNFDLVFVRVDDRISELPRGTLTRDEISVLDALSGKTSVREVVRSLRMGSFDVSRILYRLLRTRLIRHRVQPVSAA